MPAQIDYVIFVNTVDCKKKSNEWCQSTQIHSLLIVNDKLLSCPLLNQEYEGAVIPL